MAAGEPGRVLEPFAQASAEKWKSFTTATKSWSTTLRFCLILFVAQLPLDIGSVLWLLLRR